MTLMYKTLYTVLILVWLNGCALLRPDLQTPQVTIHSFRALPIRDGKPRFEIGLHVANPNRQPLVLQGLSYSVSIDGHQLLTGVSNKLPVIEAYGEGYATVTAVPDLMGSIGLIADWVSVKRQDVSYIVRVKLDVGAMLPTLYVEKAGKISLARNN